MHNTCTTCIMCALHASRVYYMHHRCNTPIIGRTHLVQCNTTVKQSERNLAGNRRWFYLVPTCITGGHICPITLGICLDYAMSERFEKISTRAMMDKLAFVLLVIFMTMHLMQNMYCIVFKSSKRETANTCTWYKHVKPCKIDCITIDWTQCK